jgi:hypothetical protein
VIFHSVVSLLPEDNLFHVKFDSDIAHIDIIQGDFVCQVIGTPVGDVSEGIKQLLCPILKERLKTQEGAPILVQEPLKFPTALDLKEVLVVAIIRDVIESEVGREVLREEELFGGTDLVEELGQDLIVRKDLGKLEVLHGEILVSAVRYLLDDSVVLIYAQNFDSLLSVMYTSDSALSELLLECRLFLADVSMREFYLSKTTLR